MKTRHEQDQEAMHLRHLRFSLTAFFFAVLAYAGFILALIEISKPTK